MGRPLEIQPNPDWSYMQFTKQPEQQHTGKLATASIVGLAVVGAALGVEAMVVNQALYEAVHLHEREDASTITDDTDTLPYYPDGEDYITNA